MNFRDSRIISFLKSIDDDNYLWFILHIQVFFAFRGTRIIQICSIGRVNFINCKIVPLNQIIANKCVSYYDAGTQIQWNWARSIFIIAKLWI